MENLRITTVQTDLHWEDKAANLAMFDRKLDGLKGQTDLVVLPEMFTTGFSMRTYDLAENMDGETVRWMKQKAAELEAAVTGSCIIEHDGKYFNRLVFVTPSGNVETYDKRHLFTMGDEHDHFTPGIKRLITTWNGWRICPLICYDLRFPVWARNTEDYDLLIYVANWPETRNFAWKTLLKARSIENQCFVIGVNRVGQDGKGLNYSGDTCVIGPMGDDLVYYCSGGEEVATNTISKERVMSIRHKLPFLNDKDDFVLK